MPLLLPSTNRDFSRIGIPSELLTDQGSVFMGKLTSQLFEKLGIKQIETSPYHPQTDGTLERWPRVTSVCYVNVKTEFGIGTDYLTVCLQGSFTCQYRLLSF